MNGHSGQSGGGGGCLVARSSLTLRAHDFNPPGSSVHGISQARILEWVALFLLQGIFPTQGSNLHLLLAGGFFTTEPPGKLSEWLKKAYLVGGICPKESKGLRLGQVPSRGSCMCKGPKVEMCLLCSRKSQELWLEQMSVGRECRKGYQEETG